ncbi:MAG TPA: GNAT family N-acetyltransferase [Woeseiaceae bacterium]
MEIGIRDVRPEELEAILALNEAAVPHVNSVPLAQLEKFRREAAYFRVAVVGGRIGGFLVGLTPEADYASPNFLWFRRRYAAFGYVDRVAIAEDARRFGLGSRLYADFEGHFRGHVPRLVCEVNLVPPNEPSMRFHERHGFAKVGEQAVDGKIVAMLVKEL